MSPPLPSYRHRGHLWVRVSQGLLTMSCRSKCQGWLIPWTSCNHRLVIGVLGLWCPGMLQISKNTVGSKGVVDCRLQSRGFVKVEVMPICVQMCFWHVCCWCGCMSPLGSFGPKDRNALESFRWCFIRCWPRWVFLATYATINDLKEASTRSIHQKDNGMEGWRLSLYWTCAYAVCMFMLCVLYVSEINPSATLANSTHFQSKDFLSCLRT